MESFVNPTLDEGKISSAVDELASGLHIPIHIIRDVNDITDDNKDTQRKKRGSKGWYDMETGEVYLVCPMPKASPTHKRPFYTRSLRIKGFADY